MTSTASAAAPHVYVDCDIPDGMTLVEWRRSHTERKPRRFPRHPVRSLTRHLPSIA
jgi:hypothetical protein